MMRNLLEHWDAFRRSLAGAPSRILLFDYDGTLAPIVSHPSRAALPERASALLERLVGLPGTAVGVVSGRSIAQLRTLCPVQGLILSGNHGYELEMPGGELLRFYGPRDLEPVRRVRDRFEQRLGGLPGVYVEDKGITVAVHDRQVPDALRPRVRQVVLRSLAAVRPACRLVEGKRVLEIRPPRSWDKGNAVSAILCAIPWGARAAYFGDDVTDEPAFRMVNRGGESVYVGPEGKRSAARWRVDDPGQVLDAVERLIAGWGDGSREAAR